MGAASCGAGGSDEQVNDVEDAPHQKRNRRATHSTVNDGALHTCGQRRVCLHLRASRPLPCAPSPKEGGRSKQGTEGARCTAGRCRGRDTKRRRDEPPPPHVDDVAHEDGGSDTDKSSEERSHRLHLYLGAHQALSASSREVSQPPSTTGSLPPRARTPRCGRRPRSRGRAWRTRRRSYQSQGTRRRPAPPCPPAERL